MKISIICVGKIKKQYLVEFNQDYLKRLNKYCNISVVELKDETLKDDSEQGILRLLKTEESLILKYLKPDSYKICMAVEGKQFTSPELALKLETIFNSYSHIQFIIGGSYGLSDDIKKMCNELISVSKMTFPHQVIRGMLLEQIYRGFKINNNETYHK